jgi:hypothetical protein
VAVIDLTSRKFSLLIGGVDFAQSLDGDLIPESDFDEMAGLRIVTAQCTLVETLTTPESLDPEENTRWVIGQTVDIEIADSAGDFIPHPGTALRILSVPTYSEIDRTLALDLGCELKYWDERTPAADCSGIDPRTGRSRDQVIANLLIAAGISAGLFAGTDNPTDVLYYPFQKFGGDSFINQAGLMAAAAPGGMRYLWADGQRRIRCDYSLNPTQPTLSLTQDSVMEFERVNPDEYARPFESLKVVGPLIIVTPEVWPKALAPVEKYSTLADLYPEQAIIFGPNPELVLVEGIYQTEIFDGNQLLRFGIVTGINKLTIFSGFIGGRAYSYDTYTSTTSEAWTFFPKPANWNSCRPELNPRSNAGLCEQYSQEHTGTGYSKSILYFYDDRQNLIRKYTRIRGAFGAGEWTEDIEWFESARGSGIWTKQTNVRAPGGNINNAYNSVNGVAKRPVIDAPPQIEFDSPPERPPTSPTGFNVGEEQISVTAKAPARGGGIAEKEKTISVPIVTSEAQLQELAEFQAGLYWGRAYGRMIKIALPDELLEATYKPVQRWDFTYPSGKTIALRVEDPLFALSPTECVVGVQAALIGVVGDDAPDTPLPPYQPVTVGEAWLTHYAEDVPRIPVLPPIIGEAWVTHYASDVTLSWADLTTPALWSNLTLDDWRALKP